MDPYVTLLESAGAGDVLVLSGPQTPTLRLDRSWARGNLTLIFCQKNTAIK